MANRLMTGTTCGNSSVFTFCSYFRHFNFMSDIWTLLLGFQTSHMRLETEHTKVRISDTYFYVFGFVHISVEFYSAENVFKLTICIMEPT